MTIASGLVLVVLIADLTVIICIVRLDHRGWIHLFGVCEGQSSSFILLGASRQVIYLGPKV